jgi:hypothetical protein
LFTLSLLPLLNPNFMPKISIIPVSVYVLLMGLSMSPAVVANSELTTWVNLQGQRDLEDKEAPTLGEFSSYFHYQYSASESLSFAAQWQLGLNYNQKKLGFTPYRLDEIPMTIADSEKYQFFHQLNQLQISFSDEFGSLSMGRIPLKLSTSKYFSTLDFITPWAGLSEEIFEPGVDAILMRSPWGARQDYYAQLGVIAGEQLTWMLINEVNVADTSVKSSIVYQEGITVMSSGNRRSDGRSEYWDEITWIYDGENHWRMSIGRTDQVFGGWATSFEYHYNQMGQELIEDYSKNMALKSYQRHWLNLQARHYLYFDLVTKLGAQSTLSMPTVWNINDGSVLYGLKADYQWSEASGFSLAGNWSYDSYELDEGQVSEFSQYPSNIEAKVMMKF